jgi:hypothetical protein
MVVFLFEMSSCGVCLEAPSWVHTGVTRALFPEGHGNFLWKNWEYWAGRKRSFRQMQTCLSKICFPQTRVVAEISIDDLPELERDARARARRCLLHILAMLRRPRTVQFHWQGIVRELRGVETQVCRPLRDEMTAGRTLWRQY